MAQQRPKDGLFDPNISLVIQKNNVIGDKKKDGPQKETIEICSGTLTQGKGNPLEGNPYWNLFFSYEIVCESYKKNTLLENFSGHMVLDYRECNLDLDRSKCWYFWSIDILIIEFILFLFFDEH